MKWASVSIAAPLWDHRGGSINGDITTKTRFFNKETLIVVDCERDVVEDSERDMPLHGFSVWELGEGLFYRGLGQSY